MTNALAMERVLHVIALNIPWPANYGGIIDIYYKVRQLHTLGYRIILHCWQYNSAPAPELESICDQVYYYPRHTGLLANLNLLPYNVASRRSSNLLTRLVQDESPILYEGLHTTYYINHPLLRKRLHIVRAHNLEHEYYYAIARAERSWLRKAFHYIEGLKLAVYERRLQHAALIAAVSTADADYFKVHFPASDVAFIPCFHAYDQVTCPLGQGDYILYHGKLSVAENTEAVLWLIRHVLSRVPYRTIVAGMDPHPCIQEAIREYPHISLISNPTHHEMARLISEAQIHLLYTKQATGLKLKLLGSLFSGRHIIVNPTMLAGSGLDALCHIGHTAEQMIALCHQLMYTPFDEAEWLRRKELLEPFRPSAQAKALADLIERFRQR